jgi:hypothetical protein
LRNSNISINDVHRNDSLISRGAAQALARRTLPGCASTPLALRTPRCYLKELTGVPRQAALGTTSAGFLNIPLILIFLLSAIITIRLVIPIIETDNYLR